VAAEDVEGNTFEEDAEDLHAVCLQHEMDHLKGRLFVDYLSPLKRRMVQKKLEKQRRQDQRELARGAVV
jgi:peptide deformylase